MNTDKSSAHTPLETLLLFQTLYQLGITTETFTLISERLKNNVYVKDSSAYNSARLSPDALQGHFFRVLREHLNHATTNGAKSVAELLPDDDTRNNDKTTGVNCSHTSPMSLSQISEFFVTAQDSLLSLEEANAHVDRLHPLVVRLYEQYREHMLREIEQDGEALERAVKEIQESPRSEAQDQTVVDSQCKVTPRLQRPIPPVTLSKPRLSPAVMQSATQSALVPNQLASPYQAEKVHSEPQPPQSARLKSGLYAATLGPEISRAAPAQPDTMHGGRHKSPQPPPDAAVARCQTVQSPLLEPAVKTTTVSVAQPASNPPVLSPSLHHGRQNPQPPAQPETSDVPTLASNTCRSRGKLEPYAFGGVPHVNPRIPPTPQQLANLERSTQGGVPAQRPPLPGDSKMARRTDHLSHAALSDSCRQNSISSDKVETSPPARVYLRLCTKWTPILPERQGQKFGHGAPPLQSLSPVARKSHHVESIQSRKPSSSLPASGSISSDRCENAITASTGGIQVVNSATTQEPGFIVQNDDSQRVDKDVKQKDGNVCGQPTITSLWPPGPPTSTAKPGPPPTTGQTQQTTASPSHRGSATLEVQVSQPVSNVDASSPLASLSASAVASPRLPKRKLSEVGDVAATAGLSTQDCAESIPPLVRSAQQVTTPSHVLWIRGFPKVSASVLDQIASHRYANMFADKIKTRDAPRYMEVILHPQDLKKIRAAINAGNKAATAAFQQLSGRDESMSSVWLPFSEQLVPPRGIINTEQLECELVHMFANAIMFNPDPFRGPGPEFKNVWERADPQNKGLLSYMNEPDVVVKDTRNMYVEVEKLLSELRSAEKDMPPLPADAVGIVLEPHRCSAATSDADATTSRAPSTPVR